MKARLTRIVVLLLCCVCCHAASEPVVLLDESFDGENSLSAWGRTSTREGRIQLVPSAADAADLEVRMDDSVDNATFSENILSREIVIPELQSLVIEFDFEAPNDERHDATLPIENPFDGIVVRSSGGGISVLSASSFS